MKSIPALLITLCLWLALALGCSKRAPQANRNSTVSPSPASSSAPTQSSDNSAKYFDGSKACKFLSNVEGFDLGNYVAYTNTEGYTCEKLEPVIKLSCSPDNPTQCNEVSYSVDGEKEGATSAEISYIGFSLHPAAHKKDMQRFLQLADQLASNALGAKSDAEINEYLSNTNKFLPMSPAPESAVLEKHALKKRLGSGFVKAFTRKNDTPGGPTYMLFFTVYPDEQWVDK
jgi:hypothetical protein